MLVALLLVASTLAGAVRPSRFMGFSILSYGYLYFAIANVFFVVVWLCAKSKWFLLPLIAIVARCGFLPLYVQVGGTEKLSDQELAEFRPLKILSLNAHKFQGVNTEPALTDSNMLLFLEMVDAENPDVLTMQEYVGRGDTVHLTERLAQRGYSYRTSAYRNGSITGTVLFSKHPIVGVAHIDGVKCRVDIQWHSDTLSLFCLHMDSYRLDDNNRREIRHISHGEVDSLTKSSTYQKFRETILSHESEWDTLEPMFRDHQRRTVVVGDFNNTPASYLYQQFKHYFKDSYREAGQGFSATYHGSFVSFRRTMLLAFRIDFVMHTDDIKTRTYKRIKSEISDHYPVVVTLQVKD